MINKFNRHTYSGEFRIEVVNYSKLKIRCKTFIEPDIVPPTHGDQVSKPLLDMEEKRASLNLI